MTDRKILKTEADWKKVHGKTERQFRALYEKDLKAILENPQSANTDKCKLNIWVRYVGPVAFYDFQLRSPHRKLYPLRRDTNQWLRLNVYELADTPKDEGGLTAEQIWTDLKYVLREYPGKRDLQYSFTNPHIESTAMDSRYNINGINPETNYNAITIQQIRDALGEKFGWEAPSRRMKKTELVEIFMEAVRTEGKSLDLEEEILT